MTFQFETAEPIFRAEANPFTEAVAAIAGKTTVKNGKTIPVASGFKVTGVNDTSDKALAKYKKQLQDAGKNLPTPVTVRVNDDDVKIDPKTKKPRTTRGGIVTFWTVPQIIRKPKTKA